MNFTPTSNADKIDPFTTKEEFEKYLRKMQDKFIKLKKKYPEEILVNELEDETFVAIIKVQKACSEKVKELKNK